MKTLYLFFDHEWSYRHVELYTEEEFSTSTEENWTFEQTYDFYDKENNKTGKHKWFLNEMNKHQKTMFNKIMFFADECKADDKTKEQIRKSFKDKKNFLSDGCGDYLVKLEVSDNDYDKMKDLINQVNEIDWRENSKAHRNNWHIDCSKIAKQNEEAIRLYNHAISR